MLRAAAESFALRAVLLASPALIVWPGETAGWVLAFALATLAQFAASATVGLREQRLQEELYVRAGETLSLASAMVPLPLPEIGPELALGRALFSRARLLGYVRPTIMGEGAAIAVALVAIGVSPWRLSLVPLALGVAAAGGLYVLLHRAALVREAVVQERFTDLYGHLALFLAERQERIAQGAAAGFVRDLRARAATHRTASLEATKLRTLVRRVPLAVAVGVVIVCGQRLGVAASLRSWHLLAAVILAQGGAAVFSAVAEQAQLEKHAGPLDALLAVPISALDGDVAPGPCDTLEGHDVHYAYPSGGEVVSALSFDVRKGRPLVLRGANGTGKSTVLRLVCGLASPTRGDISFDGVDTRRLDPSALRQRVAFVSQQTHFDPNATVHDAMRATDDSVSAHAIDAALIAMGFSDLPALRAKLMGTLSSGQRRRVQLSRAFALQRPILVLDEPEAGLDASTQRLVRELVLREAEQRLVVIATHSELFDPGVKLGGVAEAVAVAS